MGRRKGIPNKASQEIAAKLKKLYYRAVIAQANWMLKGKSSERFGSIVERWEKWAARAERALRKKKCLMLEQPSIGSKKMLRRVSVATKQEKVALSLSAQSCRR